MTYNIMTCGVGGQGLMLLSNIIGLACAENNLNIRTAETHGLAQRSGSIYTHIRIGDDAFSPLIPYGEADALLGMEAIETLRYIEFLKPNGIIILNNYIWHPVQSTYERVKNPQGKYLNIESIINKLNKYSNHLFLINALDIAIEAGNSLTTNVVLLGALIHTKDFPLSFNQLEETLPRVVPKSALDVNKKALFLGYKSIE
ncbi:MAG: indolepyruvate ferredoxin oxidoreductase subunit beta [Candidatus Lokiarchaeota archaeon]|nr:indolepyruvate ferredoxin oxidoreductase subunit beta [Candidatus Lokiarchaeota archaeon]